MTAEACCGPCSAVIDRRYRIRSGLNARGAGVSPVRLSGHSKTEMRPDRNELTIFDGTRRAAGQTGRLWSHPRSPV